jgi:hypothetical protein
MGLARNRYARLRKVPTFPKVVCSGSFERYSSETSIQNPLCGRQRPTGQQWLRLLVLAAVFVFALKSGVGCERLSEFFHLLRLQHHVGVSPSALRTLRTKMEGKILEYQQLQQNQLLETDKVVEICASRAKSSLTKTTWSCWICLQDTFWLRN